MIFKAFFCPMKIAWEGLLGAPQVLAAVTVNTLGFVQQF
jgi:hypothetical protein